MDKTATPTAVRGQWLSSSQAVSVPGGMLVRGIFAGGDQSFASLVVPGEQVRVGWKFMLYLLPVLSIRILFSL